MAQSNEFIIKFSKFYKGFAPLAHLNSLTEVGDSGQAASMSNVDVLSPDYLTQGPGLANLTNGTQAAAVTELINFIMDEAVSSGVTYGIGNTKLFQINTTSVTNAGSFPHTITGATAGNSVATIGGKLYYFYNKSSGGDIGQYDLTSTFNDDWGSTVPTGAAALQKADHPVARKEDLMVFGNGQYLGVYTDSTTTLAPTKLDFGSGNLVADVVFHANQWWVAVNSGVSGTNRNKGEIYLYDGAATSSVLSDETGVGLQKIGFLYVLNGIVFVAYQDLSSTGGYKIGYISGRQIKPLRYFTGSLPTFAQKTLYKDTILFISSSSIYSIGAVVDSLPIQISQHADAGYSTVGAIAAPFGTPLVASTDGTTNFRLAKFSGFDTACTWKSIIIPVINGKMKGYIDDVVVLTKSLGTSSRCDLVIQANQGGTAGTTKQITTAGKRWHSFNELGLGTIEDFRISLDWSNGDTTNDCAIRQIIVIGHYVEE